jgi:predicted aconitase
VGNENVARSRDHKICTQLSTRPQSLKLGWLGFFGYYGVYISENRNARRILILYTDSELRSLSIVGTWTHAPVMTRNG